MLKSFKVGISSVFLRSCKGTVTLDLFFSSESTEVFSVVICQQMVCCVKIG